MTTPETNADEMIAGVAAATDFLDTNLPRWARRMISNDQIRVLVMVVVDAVDLVRDQQTPPPEGDANDIP